MSAQPRAQIAACLRHLFLNLICRRKNSTTKASFEHVDHGVLLGNYLGLPNQRDGHHAHGKNAESQDEACLGFVCRYKDHAAQPGHGKLLLNLSPVCGGTEDWLFRSRKAIVVPSLKVSSRTNITTFSAAFCFFLLHGRRRFPP